MKKRYLLILLATTLASLVLNIFLFNQARRYYVELNETRLDPLGLDAYHPDTKMSSNTPFKALFYGDSRAANWPAPDKDNSITYLNRGIAAQTTAQAWLRFQYHVPPLKPQVMILQIGINDLKTIPLFPERRAAIILLARKIFASSFQRPTTSARPSF